MKTFIFIISIFSLVFTGNAAFAHSDDIGVSSDSHTATEEAEGKALWEKLQAKEVACADLSDDDFGALGEYFMGKMMGEQHETMNTMMAQMMGEDGEKQMHIAMGKRMSECDPNAPMPQNMMGGGAMPMMQMMGGGMMGGGDTANSPTWNLGQNMVWQWQLGAWLVWLLYAVWLAVGVLAVIWLWKEIIKKK